MRLQLRAARDSTPSYADFLTGQPHGRLLHLWFAATACFRQAPTRRRAPVAMPPAASLWKWKQNSSCYARSAFHAERWSLSVQAEKGLLASAPL